MGDANCGAVTFLPRGQTAKTGIAVSDSDPMVLTGDLLTLLEKQVLKASGHVLPSAPPTAGSDHFWPCPGFRGDRVNFLPNSWYSAAFWI